MPDQTSLLVCSCKSANRIIYLQIECVLLLVFLVLLQNCNDFPFNRGKKTLHIPRKLFLKGKRGGKKRLCPSQQKSLPGREGNIFHLPVYYNFKGFIFFLLLTSLFSCKLSHQPSELIWCHGYFSLPLKVRDASRICLCSLYLWQRKYKQLLFNQIEFKAK